MIPLRTVQQRQNASIELTPMIDMVFLLLIFFLVATTFQQDERELDIALPEAANAAPLAEALQEIVVNVDAHGAMRVNGRTVSPEQLQALLTQAVHSNPEQKVTVRGDRAAPYALIVRALDVCKAAGVRTPFLDAAPGQQ
ncbi:MAG: biopolymer transporter ExbD [Planctomycetota bacterium]|nr:MAG: biopolymer transporter ExbD [Planctomycetota bacterium]